MLGHWQLKGYKYPFVINRIHRDRDADISLPSFVWLADNTLRPPPFTFTSHCITITVSIIVAVFYYLYYNPTILMIYVYSYRSKEREKRVRVKKREERRRKEDYKWNENSVKERGERYR